MHNNLIASNEELVILVNKLRSDNRSIVFTNGAFDIIHKGHVYCLEEAKKLGDVLIVGLCTDNFIKLHKSSNRPINRFEERAYVLSGLRAVDYVIALNENMPQDLIDLINIVKPDIHVKGGDYDPEKLNTTNIVKSHGGKVIIIPYIENISTSIIIERVKK